MRTFALLILLTTPALGASHYIRAGAAGTNDGSSWVNAWSTLAAANSAGFVRGDTYYLAGGTYAESLYLNVSLSGTSRITIKKANAADNGSDPGWNASYASTVAIITASVGAGAVLDLDKGYVTIDGVTGSGFSGHGIKIYNTSTAQNAYGILLESGKSFFELAHCEVVGSGFAAGALPTYGIYQNSVTNTKGTYIHHCWIHETTVNGGLFSTQVGTSYSDYGMKFEYNAVSEIGGCTDPDFHGQGLALGLASEMGYCIYNGNIFRNVVGSGVIIWLTSGDGANHHDNQVTNNIFYNTDTTTYNIVSPGIIWHEGAKTYTGSAMVNCLIANNVFYNITSGTNYGQVVLEVSTSGNVLENNVWENCQFTATHSGLQTQSNNGYYNNNGSGIPSGTTNQIDGVASTFTNAAGYDFTLVSGGYGVAAGLNLYSTFTTYADGSARSNSAFDLGALPVGGMGAGGSVIAGSLKLAGYLSVH